MTEQDRKDLLLLHAAGALEPAQEQAINARLAAGDPAIAGALVEAQSVVARLSGTAGAVQPSAGLRQRILDQLPARKTDAVRPERTDSVETKATARPPKLQFGRGRSGQGSFWPKLAMAAAIGAIVVGGPLGFVAWRQNSDRSQAESDANKRVVQAAEVRDKAMNEVAALSQAYDRLLSAAKETEKAKIRAELAAKEMGPELDGFRNTLASGDIRLATLSTDKAATRPNGRVFWDVKNNRWLVYIFDLQPAPVGRQYQLWILPEGGQPIPAPLFQVDASGRAVRSVDLPKDLTKANIAVTDEPPGGSKAPTSPIRLIGNL